MEMASLFSAQEISHHIPAAPPQQTLEQQLYAKLKEIKKALSEDGARAKKPVLIETRKTSDGKIHKETYRPFISSCGNLCYFPKGRRRSGPYYELSSDAIDVELRFPQQIKSKAEKWRDSWLKVQKHLEGSGLWPELLQNVKTALDIGYKKLQAASKTYWNDDQSLSYDQRQEKNRRDIAMIDSRLTDDKNVHTEIVWHMSKKAKVKKMYFGKYDNERKLAEIKEAMENGKECKVSGRASYDVSFHYNPATKMAWYSEEFKDCGNGHYYLALSGTHALFYEDD